MTWGKILHVTKIFRVERFFRVKGGYDMKKFLALVVFLCTVMISSMAMASNWVWIYSDDNYTIYVDNNSIRRDYNYSSYVFRAFVKFVYSDAGRDKVIEDWRTDGRPLPRGIYNLSKSICLCYFKLTDGMKYFDTLNAVYYTLDGNIISEMGFTGNTHQWTIITPDSIAEDLFYKIGARVPN